MKKIILLILFITNIHAMNMFVWRKEANIFPLEPLEKLARNLADQVSSLPAQPVSQAKHRLVLPRTPEAYSICVLASKLLLEKGVPVQCHFEPDPTATQPSLFGDHLTGNYEIQIPEGTSLPDKKTLEKEYLEAIERCGRGWQKVPSPDDINYRIYTIPEHFPFVEPNDSEKLFENLTLILQVTGIAGKVYSHYPQTLYAYLKITGHSGNQS